MINEIEFHPFFFFFLTNKNKSWTSLRLVRTLISKQPALVKLGGLCTELGK